MKNKVRDRVFYPSYVRQAFVVRYIIYAITVLLILVFYGTIIYDFIYPNNKYENLFSIIGWVTILFFIISWKIEDILLKYCEYRFRKMGEIHPAISNAARETLDRGN